jgi:MraZ protein
LTGLALQQRIRPCNSASNGNNSVIGSSIWGGRGIVFLGTHTPRLDDKGRLFMPAKFRDRLAGGLVVTRGQERCLYVFPIDEFAAIVASAGAAPVTSKGTRDYLRLLTSAASDEIPDKQGRVTVPATLREYAGLTRDCTVIGAGTRVELWDTTAWNAYLANTEQAYADQSEEVIPGLL